MRALLFTFAAALVLAASPLSAGAVVTTTGGGNSSVTHRIANMMIVRLNMLNASGENGTATIAQSGTGTSVVINVTGEAKGASQPAHIHFGSCASPGAIRNGLNNVVAGHSSTTLSVPYSQFASGAMVIVLHKGAGLNLAHYMSCGTIH